MNNKKLASSLIPVRLGALLVSAGYMSQHAVQSALIKSRQTRAFVGQCLVETNALTADELQCALDLQKMIKEGSITYEMGINSLKAAREQTHKEKYDTAEIRKEVETRREVAAEPAGAKEKYPTIENTKDRLKTLDLASILLETGCITEEQLQQATWNAGTNFLPLGRNLVMNGAITPAVLGQTLNVLILLRDKKINGQAAVKALTQCVRYGVRVEDMLNMPSTAISPNHVRIGELLSASGLVSENDAMIAAERGLMNKLSIGQSLLELQMISPLILDGVLRLQQLVEQKRVTLTQAAELLRQVASKQIGVDHFLSEMSYIKSRVLELLIESNLVSQGRVQEALEACNDDETDMVRALMSANMLSPELFRSAVRCVYSIDSCDYTKPQAIAWLQYNFGKTNEPGPTTVAPNALQTA